MSFGPSDISANDWGFSGANSFWTNWSTSSVNSGSLNRATAIACRWGAYDSVNQAPRTTTGRNNIWIPGSSRVATTNANSTATSDTGAFLNTAVDQTYWLGHTSYQGGMWRTAAQTSTTPFRDGSGGNYAGKSADDANNGGGTTNWAGVGSPGGLGWVCSSVNNKIFVMKSGVWTECQVFVYKSGSWTVCPVLIRKSNAWTVLNYLRGGYHVPERGLPIEVFQHGEWVPGIMVEAGPMWFGTIDPTTLGLDDWTKPGEYVNARYPAPFTGRYNSIEPQEIADARLYAYDRWERALARGDHAAAVRWKAAFQPELTPTLAQLRGEFRITIGGRKNGELRTTGLTSPMAKPETRIGSGHDNHRSGGMLRNNSR